MFLVRLINRYRACMTYVGLRSKICLFYLNLFWVARSLRKYNKYFVFNIFCRFFWLKYIRLSKSYISYFLCQKNSDVTRTNRSKYRSPGKILTYKWIQSTCKIFTFFYIISLVSVSDKIYFRSCARAIFFLQWLPALSVLGSAKETAKDFETQGPDEEMSPKTVWQKIRKKAGDLLYEFLKRSTPSPYFYTCILVVSSEVTPRFSLCECLPSSILAFSFL